MNSSTKMNSNRKKFIKKSQPEPPELLLAVLLWECRLKVMAE